MSTRLTLDELKAEVLARKKKSNSINLIKSNHNNRNPIESSAAGSNHNNKEQPQANHGATASQPQANHNNLAVQSGLKNLVLKVRREKSNKAEGEALNEKTQKPSIWECVAPEVKAEYDKAVE